MTVTRRTDHDYQDLPGRRSADPLSSVATESSLRLVELERTDGRSAHRHPFSEEIVYVEAGSGEVWIEGDRHRVEPGDVVRIPRGAAHATIPYVGQHMRLVCFFPHPTLGENLEDTEIEVT